MNETTERCDLCGGELRPGTTTLEIWQGDDLVVIRDVPARLCRQCDEAYVSADVSERLDEFIGERDKHEPKRRLAVPEYSVEQAIGQ